MRTKSLFGALCALKFIMLLGGSQIYSQQKLWTILICTLEERQSSFERLHAKLQNQIDQNKLHDQVEIRFFRDNRQASIGFKRNYLVNSCDSDYISFIDDDDDIHKDYITMIYEKLLKRPDCVNLIGIMTTNGKNPEYFFHTIRFGGKYCTEQTPQGRVHYRPPNHLNPIRRTIAQQFPFREINSGEDQDFAIRLFRSGLLQHEETINIPYYFYLYDGKYS